MIRRAKKMLIVLLTEWCTPHSLFPENSFEKTDMKLSRNPTLKQQNFINSPLQIWAKVVSKFCNLKMQIMWCEN